MDNNYRSLIENLDRNGLLPQTQTMAANTDLQQVAATGMTNIFSSPTATPPAFGNLTMSPKIEIKENVEFVNDSTIIDGFDTDILSNSKFKKIDDKTLKLKVKIARLKTELEEHQKLVQQTFLKTDKIQYQKLLEIQQKMEAEIQRLVAEYQRRQLMSIVFSPFVKLLNFLKSM